MNVVFSVIFPQNLPYLNSFINSLENQIEKNFTLILVNDGVDELRKHIKNTNFPIKVIEIENLNFTHFEIRLYGLRSIIELGASKIIFADSDDEFSNNRILLTLRHLENYSIVCNDLALMSEDGLILSDSFWGKRLGETFEFSNNFIREKNIIGFGNSGIVREKLIEILQMLKDTKEGFDWLFFSSYEKEYKALFFSGAKTFYRQHSRNLIGAKQLTLEKLMQKITLKISHYENILVLKKDLALKDEIYKYQNILKKSNLFFTKKLNQINSSSINFYWFEETTLLI